MLRRGAWRDDKAAWSDGKEMVVTFLARHAATRFNVIPHEIFGKSHEARLIEARRMIAVNLRHRGWSLTRIGRALKRHHTTVLPYLKDYAQGQPHELLILREPHRAIPPEAFEADGAYIGDIWAI